MFAPGIWATAREHIFSTIRAQSSFSVFVERVSRSLSVLVMSYLAFVIMFRVRVFRARARSSDFVICLLNFPFLANKTNQTNTTNQLIVIWHLNFDGLLPKTHSAHRK